MQKTTVLFNTNTNNCTVTRKYNTWRGCLRNKNLKHISRKMRGTSGTGRSHSLVSKTGGVGPLLALAFSLHIHHYPGPGNRCGPGQATRSSKHNSVSSLPWRRRAIYQREAAAWIHGSQKSLSSRERNLAGGGCRKQKDHTPQWGWSEEVQHWDSTSQRSPQFRKLNFRNFWRFYRVQLNFKQCLTG